MTDHTRPGQPKLTATCGLTATVEYACGCRVFATPDRLFEYPEEKQHCWFHKDQSVVRLREGVIRATTGEGREQELKRQRVAYPGDAKLVCLFNALFWADSDEEMAAAGVALRDYVQEMNYDITLAVGEEPLAKAMTLVQQLSTELFELEQPR